MKAKHISVLFRIVVSIAVAIMVLSLGPLTGNTAEPVRIGYLLSLSGPYAAVGVDMRDGFNLCMDEVGRKAGGRSIKVIVQDIGSNQVSKALDAARRLYEKDRIEILAGVVGSGSAYALAGFVRKHKMPFVIGNAGADDLTQRKNSPFIVRPAFVNSAGSHPLGEWAYEKGFRKAVLLGADYAAGYEHVGGIADTFKKKGGKVIQEIWTPLGTMDFAPYLAKIDRDADVIFIFLAGADALRFVKQYANYGLKDKLPVVAKGYLVDDKILPKLGADADGIISESHWCYVLDTPENRKFTAAYMKKYGHKPTGYSEQGYLTAKLIVEALNKTGGKVEGEKFVKTMRSLELKAPRGVVKFDEFGATVQNSYIRKVEQVNGGRESVPFKTYEAVGQFWTWSPKEYMSRTPYNAKKGKWAQ